MTTTYRLYGIDTLAHTPEFISGSVDLRRAIARGAHSRGMTPQDFRAVLDTWRCHLGDVTSFGPDTSTVFAGALTFGDFHAYLMAHEPDHRPVSVQRMARHMEPRDPALIWRFFWACSFGFCAFLLYLLMERFS